MNAIANTILAVLLGEITLVLLTTVAQEILVDGVSVTTSSTPDLLIGGIATLIAAIISGAIATWIGGSQNKTPVLIISILVVAETIYLISAGKTSNPMWFAICSALALIVSLWIGYFVFGKIKKQEKLTG